MPIEQIRGAQVISKAGRLLRCFDNEPPELALGELAKRTGIHPATAHRILQALVNEGLLAQDADTSKYRIGFGLVKLGELGKKTNPLLKIAYPFLERLVNTWCETTILDVLNPEMEVITVLHIPASYRLSTIPNYDRPSPAHCTATGKVLLAYLPQPQLDDFLKRKLPVYTDHTITIPEKVKDEMITTRERGYATNLEEQEIGLNAVATPIMDFHSRVIAAISIGGPTSRISLEKIPELARSLSEASRDISASLGFTNKNPD